jgi:hypothetical protein
MTRLSYYPPRWFAFFDCSCGRFALRDPSIHPCIPTYPNAWWVGEQVDIAASDLPMLEDDFLMPQCFVRVIPPTSRPKAEGEETRWKTQAGKSVSRGGLSTSLSVSQLRVKERGWPYTRAEPTYHISR